MACRTVNDSILLEKKIILSGICSKYSIKDTNINWHKCPLYALNIRNDERRTQYFFLYLSLFPSSCLFFSFGMKKKSFIAYSDCHFQTTNKQTNKEKNLESVNGMYNIIRDSIQKNRARTKWVQTKATNSSKQLTNWKYHHQQGINRTMDGVGDICCAVLRVGGASFEMLT